MNLYVKDILSTTDLKKHSALGLKLSAFNCVLLILAVVSELYLRPQLELSLINLKMVRYGLFVTPLGCVSGIVIGWTFHVLSAVEEKSSKVGFFSERHLHYFSILGFIVPPLTPLVLVFNGLLSHAMQM